MRRGHGRCADRAALHLLLRSSNVIRWPENDKQSFDTGNPPRNADLPEEKSGARTRRENRCGRISRHGRLSNSVD